MSKRIFLATAVVIGSLFVTTGCSAVQNLGGGASEPSITLHFENEDLVVGKYVPKDKPDEEFQPCSDLTAAEFEAAGFKGQEPKPEGSSLCILKAEDLSSITALVMNPMTRADIKDEYEVLDEFTSTLLPDGIVIADPKDRDNMCSFAIETNQGFFTAMTNSLKSNANTEDACPLAIEVVENFYKVGSEKAAS